MIKDMLFAVFGYVSVIALILILLWVALEFLNRIFKFTKYIIMYHQYKRDRELYSNKNNIIISQDGNIRYSCHNKSIDELITTLNKSISKLEAKKKLQEKFRMELK